MSFFGGWIPAYPRSGGGVNDGSSTFNRLPRPKSPKRVILGVATHGAGLLLGGCNSIDAKVKRFG